MNENVSSGNLLIQWASMGFTMMVLGIIMLVMLPVILTGIGCAYVVCWFDDARKAKSGSGSC